MCDSIIVDEPKKQCAEREHRQSNDRKAQPDVTVTTRHLLLDFSYHRLGSFTVPPPSIHAGSRRLIDPAVHLELDFSLEVVEAE